MIQGRKVKVALSPRLSFKSQILLFAQYPFLTHHPAQWRRRLLLVMDPRRWGSLGRLWRLAPWMHQDIVICSSPGYASKYYSPLLRIYSKQFFLSNKGGWLFAGQTNASVCYNIRHCQTRNSSCSQQTIGLYMPSPILLTRINYPCVFYAWLAQGNFVSLIE